MTETTQIDFTEDLKTGDINKIIDEARRMYQTQTQIAKLESELKERKELLRLLSTEVIPAVMQEETAADEIHFDNGYSMKLKPVVAGSIPAESAIMKCKDEDKKSDMIDRRHNCLNWLNQNNASSLIVNTFTAIIPKPEKGKEDETAKKVSDLIALCDELELESSLEQKIHPATLNSYLKEKIGDQDEESSEIPFDLFNIFVGKQAVIVPPKK